jgi:hypothetical protein
MDMIEEVSEMMPPGDTFSEAQPDNEKSPGNRRGFS